MPLYVRHSAQEMIKSLDAEISELKITNKELLADMDACRRRETDKLELTAKLSRKNAELQSENTSLSNKVSFWLNIYLLPN